MLYKHGFVNNLLRNYNKNTKITSERIRTRSISYVYRSSCLNGRQLL